MEVSTGMVLISDDTAAWLLGLVSSLSLNAAAPDFDEAVAAVQQARRELTTPFAPPAED
jgi:hypothetical protein